MYYVSFCEFWFEVIYETHLTLFARQKQAAVVLVAAVVDAQFGEVNKNKFEQTSKPPFLFHFIFSS
jgi:hypothetical protein